MESRKAVSSLSSPLSLYPSPSSSKSWIEFLRWIFPAFGNSLSASESKNLLREKAVFMKPNMA